MFREREKANQNLEADLPNPYPPRAIYGLACCFAGFILYSVYFCWAYVPDYLLQYTGFTYLPAKYWAVALPFAFVCLVFLYPLLLFLWTAYHSIGLYERGSTVDNDFRD
ncbi:unnamed protein product [Bursaphelenchus okinawaensis]|uniref:PIG-P domain-containing protein n=1 Tax=Bursaphelenchus okinawaensis TaxID=465554 RepID=A0A811K7V3_9BILA|nr:unnamed protein product [Bursaphelenchus okinawaensis]CAG9095099.1 unnamed protein product [Bursaphelenchus okinawaensis]